MVLRRVPILIPFLALFHSLSAQSVAEADFEMGSFQFKSGEGMDHVRIHYRTLGAIQRDATGHVTNAVLILHGTGGTGAQFLGPMFKDVLFQPGQPLDTQKYFVILPDNLGHGSSSKPSDGLKGHFPHYDYSDMVEAQYRLVTEGLKIDRLRLVLGTSMGCMHSFVWGERHPQMMDALMPLACLPVQIAGRNRLWRKMLMDSIRDDPSWEQGNYKKQPAGLKEAVDLLILAGGAPLPMQKSMPARDAADAWLAKSEAQRLAATDANDLLYQVDSSRTYDPSPELEKIVAPLMLVNSADDFINPPELDIAMKEIQRVKHGTFVLLPITPNTHGHGTHTDAKIWKQYLQNLLAASERH